jgi:site-specific DNA recombinase
MKALLYCRVSTGKQGEDGSSLESQLQACNTHALDLGYEVAGEYRDIYSGAYLYDRPNLERLRSRVRQGDIDALVVHSVDRLSRNQAHLFIIAEELERYNTKLVFVTEAFDTTPEGKLLQSVKSYVAEVEREKIRERSMRGRLTKIKNGTISHRRPLYGYIVQPDGQREPCPVTAPVVREMFTAILNGGSLRSLATELTTRGIPTPNGRSTWWANSIATILKNPAYFGRVTMFRYKHGYKMKDGKRTHVWTFNKPEHWIAIEQGNTPPLVTEQEFTDVQAALAVNRKSKRRVATVEALLRGMIRCGVCGRQMTPAKSGNARRYYICTSKQNPSTRCSVPSLGADIVEAAVWSEIEGFVRNPEELKRMRDEAESEAVPRDDELSTISKSISQCEAEIARIENNIALADARSFDALNKRLGKKHDELGRLKGVIVDLLEQPSDLPDIDTILAHAKDTLADMTFENRVTLLKYLGLQITWAGGSPDAAIFTASYCQSNRDELVNTTPVKIALSLT